MNRNIYRLVFNRSTGLLTVVSEIAKRGRAVGAGAALLLTPPLAQAAGPLTAIPGSTLPDHVNAVVQSGVANFVNGSRTFNGAAYNSLNVDVATAKAIIQWPKFNIGSQAWVDFNHATGATGATLNRIMDANPSQILGRLTSNGQVFLINQNGILFGNGAQVNVGGLVASSLNIDNSRFLAGLLSNVDKPAFEGTSGFVKVLQGAEILAQGGRVMLLAPTVVNAGTVSAPDGQIVLAAGDKIYLLNSEQANLRGLVVEVDNTGLPDTKQANSSVPAEVQHEGFDQVGKASNLGSLLSAHGNITMVGLAVNQSGLARATTSVQLNGSILLKAQDTVIGVSPLLSVSRAGEMVLAAGSRTEVLPDEASGLTAVDSQILNRSKIDVQGKTILMESNAGITAPNGKVTFSAVLNPASLNSTAQEGVRVDFRAGSFVDVAGSTATVSAARNVVKAELRGDELKDSPLQRDGILYRSKVNVDVEKGTPLADVSGYTKTIGRSVTEHSGAGGEIRVESEGDILFREGARFDISGGKTIYTAAWVPTTQLISEGKVYDISTATPDRVYDGIVGQYKIYNPKFGVNQTIFLQESYRYEPGYVEGKNAGSATFISPWLVKNGTVLGHTTLGTYQRDPAKQPKPGTLQIGHHILTSGVYDNKLLASVVFGTMAADPGLGLGDKLPEAYKETLVLSPDFRRDGIGNVLIYSNGEIKVPKGQGIALAASGQGKDSDGNTTYTGGLTLSGAKVTVDDTIRVPAGQIVLEARTTNTSTSSGVANDVVVAAGVRLDASGVWTNDSKSAAQPDGVSALAYDGGKVTLTAEDNLTLNAGSVVDVSGGAWLQTNSKLKPGNAGSIELASSKSLDPAVERKGSMVLGGELRAYALGKGGKLTVKAAQVQIRDNARDDGDPAQRLVLAPGFLNQGGFAEYKIEGIDGLSVAAGTVIAPTVTSLELLPTQLESDGLASDYARQASGADWRAFTRPVLLPVHLRQPVKLSLTSTSPYFGELHIGAGARLSTDPGGSISLSSKRQLTMLGNLSARAGKIDLKLDGDPSDTGDLGFRPEQSLWLGAGSSIDVSGIAKTYSDNDLTKGEVLAGGQVTLTAAKGYVVAEAGSTINVSGAKPVHLDIPNAEGGIGQQVASDAGSVSIAAREGIFMDTVLHGQAGAATARGGSFAAKLDRANTVRGSGDDTPPGFQPSYPTADRILLVQDTGQVVQPKGLQQGQAVPDAENGKGFVNLGDLARAGFERFALNSDTKLLFQGPLSVGQDRQLRSIDLGAQVIGSENGQPLNLKAQYLSLGNPTIEQQELSATGAGAALTFKADLIDLYGKLALQGVSAARFESQGDIRFLGYDKPDSQSKVSFAGALTAAGDLAFKAAQLYPTTLSRFEVKTDGAISIEGNGMAAPAALSAAGYLGFTAKDIYQGGTVHAPFGQLAFNATETLALQSGSVTSVAGVDGSGKAMLIPFGSTLNEREWVYYDTAPDGSVIQRFADLPGKQINLKGKTVTVAADVNKVDLSGGGDLLGYEFFVGPGGSRDILSDKGMYAILPGYDYGFAPSDLQYNTNFDRLPGDRVYLAGGNGLKAGLYTLLPAHYALLPGALAVRSVAGVKDFVPGQGHIKADGIQVMSGFFTDTRYESSGVRDARWLSFEVLSGSRVRERSEFALYKAGDFFSETSSRGPLPRDAGRLGFDISGTTLALSGRFDLAAAGNGRAAEVDIVAPKIAVAGAGTAVDTDALRLDPQQLNALKAGSLLLGGTRSDGNGSTVIDVKSESVKVANGPSNALVAPEIILAAKDTLELSAGSVLKGVAGKTSQSRDYSAAGNGALLLLSSFDARFSRTGTPDGSQGTLTIAQDPLLNANPPVLVAGKTAVLDGTKDTSNEGKLVFADADGKPVTGGSLTLGSPIISIGAVPANTAGLVLDQSDLNEFNSLDRLTLNSYSSIDLYGAPTLGSAQFKELNLNSGGLKGKENSGQTASLQAATIRLTNTAGVVPGTAGTGDGTLDLRADRLILGQGAKTISGFNTLTASTHEIIGEGNGGLDVGAANTTLTTARITGAAGATQSFKSSGAIATLQQTLAQPLAAVTALGAQWTFEGKSISHGSRMEMPAGNVYLTATGGDLVIGPRGSILAKGAWVDFADTAVAAPGGNVKLISKTGNVQIQADTIDATQHGLIDVSAADSAAHPELPPGEAGSLSMVASSGAADMAAGTIKGQAGGTQQSGRFELDVGSLTDFSTLNTRLNQGGFNRAQNLRVRSGDVIIAASDQAKAHDYQLAADSGKITVKGEIDASGKRGGRIGLYAGTGLSLAGAKLKAQASGAGERGGRVELAAGSGSLDLQPDSTIDVSPGSGGQKGEVLLRAQRTGSDAGNGVNVTQIASRIIGAESVVLEAVKRYDNISTLRASGSGATLSYTTINNDNTAFMSHAGAIEASLNKDESVDATFHLRPGVEVQAPADLVVSSDWNLYSAARPGDEPGVLTLRATGDLKVNGSLSDGFTTPTKTGILKDTQSWSYRLVAGADLAAANPVATKEGAGNFSLAAGKLIRTGTGDIRIAAGGDFDLGKASSGSAANSKTSVIYTAGTVAPSLDNFTQPKGATFSQGGGDIDIAVRGNIRGAETSNLYSAWLYRQGSASKSSAWWVKFSDFEQGVAALAGGNVSVRADGNIDDLSVSSVNQGRVSQLDSGDTTTRSLQVLGSGDVYVDAGGDIAGGKFYVADGSGVLRARGALAKGQDVTTSQAGGLKSIDPLYPVLALGGNSQWDVRARGDANLATILNPFVIAQSVGNASPGVSAPSYFFTYGELAAAKVVSLSGNVLLSNNPRPVMTSATISSVGPNALAIYPGSLQAAALQGDLRVGSMVLYPAPKGQLNLLAARDVTVDLIHMSDVSLGALPSPVAPVNTPSVFSSMQSSTYRDTGSVFLHAAAPVHAGDSEPVRIVAKTGDLQLLFDDAGSKPGFLLPKPAVIEAGGDIRNLNLITQHFADTDATRVTAGGSIKYLKNNKEGSIDDLSIQVWGPGDLFLNAGKDIDLDVTRGVLTRGNLDNPALPAGGANIHVLAGTAKFDERVASLSASFRDALATGQMSDSLLSEARLLTGNPELSAADALSELAKVQPLAGAVGRLQQRIEQVLARAAADEVLLTQARLMTGNESLTLADAPAALALLAAKPVAEREAISRKFLVAALTRYGREAADPSHANFKNYAAAHRSLNLVFPGANCDGQRCQTANYAGDVNLFFSQLKTERGGDIEVFTPGGRLLVGLANTPISLINAKASDRVGGSIYDAAAAKLGIMTLDGGDIRLIAANDILVNQSRVLTVAGGDILAWSSFRGIDAGKGKKTVVSAPPPRVTTNKDGNVVIEIQGLASGSGIGSLLTKPNQETSSIDLFAPHGTIDAGDAGIRSAGNLTLGALQVRGADNIQVSGVSVGVPVADSGLGAGLAGLGDVASTASKVAEDVSRGLADQTNERQGFLGVEVIGFGE